jgi:ketosteroid isomerase-like protein
VTTDENKHIMQEVFAQLSTGNARPFLDCMADDVVWTIAGSSKWSKAYDGKRAVQSELLGPLFSQFADRYASEAHRFIAEDDYVVVEARGHVTTKAGLPYNNAYCYIFRLRDGEVTEITEYSDTQLIATALRDPKEVRAPVAEE